MKAFLVDDEFLQRKLVKKSVDWQSIGIELCGEAEDGEEALEMIRNGECGTFNPLLLQCMTEAQDKLKTMMEVAENELKGVEKTE